LEVGERLLDRGLLVGRLLVREACLELLHRPVAPGEGVPRRELARGVHGEELLRHVAQRAAHALLGALPGRAAKPVEARGVAVGAGVALDQVEPVHGDEQPRVLGVVDAQELARDAAQLEPDEAAVDADAVLGVHEVVADREVAERLDGGRVGPAGLRALALAPKISSSVTTERRSIGSAKPSESAAMRISTAPGRDQRQTGRGALSTRAGMPYSARSARRRSACESEEAVSTVRQRSVRQMP